MKTVDDNKENVILINKADLMTAEQRSAWAEFFEKENVKVIFWSALSEAIQLIDDSKVTWGTFSGWVSRRRILASVKCALFFFVCLFIVDVWGFICFFFP